ncbi:MAG: hypothetical protein A3J74_09270 [Elusimicrobia bacterium RIFCSPHIGHO2_02_FULL_57_9]|nr:MAG: hypothetical protein A3J74_09270 [Elusimicrobia bacterium RIFCSPHIGHO2_02_FULL_57_9]
MGCGRIARGASGVSLVELMVATGILSVGILGLVGATLGIQKSIQNSKSRTLAANLAQEKLQILTQKSYYQVLVTTDPSYRTDYSPNIPYDGGYFPPESVLEGGIRFTRLSYVQVAQEISGSLTFLSPTTQDTSLKLITVTVLWAQGADRKKLQVKRIFANPDTSMANCIFTGTVRSASSPYPAINGALVNVAENMGWRNASDAAGSYTINLNPGDFTIMASALGFFPELRNASIAANQSSTQDFDLIPMSSGTIRGTAWMNPNLIISQVVVQTNTWVGGGSFKNVEYIELFNPTTAAIDMGLTGNSQVRIDYDAEAAGLDHPHADFNFVYMTTHVPAGKHYLIANATSFMILGSVISADACYGLAANCDSMPTFPDYLDNHRAGDIRLANYATNTPYDVVGWKDGELGSDMPDNFEGAAIPNYTAGGLDGIGAGNQIVRTSSPSFISDIYARAYDSDNNSLDFFYPSASFTGVEHRPRSSADSSQPLVAGKPANGAVISSIDGLSSPTTAYLVGSPPRAEFSLTQVATGTWTVFIASGGLFLENSTVTIAASGAVYTFPSSTTILTESNSFGFISGTVTDGLGAVITNPFLITVSPGAAGSSVSAANGRYLLQVVPGVVDVTANPGNSNPNYVSQSSQALNISLGEVKSGVDFMLSQGGRISGFVSRDGSNPLPGVAVAVLDANGSSHDQQVSDLNGRFTTVNMATGAYSVEPVLGSHESSNPAATSVTVAIGETVSAGTFTISGALGTIAGSVNAGGASITTGVLIVVTTTTLSGTPPAPPALSTATLTSVPYYITSSYEDGSYAVEVRQSTAAPFYNAYGYYTTVSSTGAVSISYQQLSNISVTAGQTTANKNFSW